MARVRLYRQKYAKKDLSEYIIGKMKAHGYKQTDLADWLGITQPAAQNRLKKGLFSYGDMIIIFERLEATDDDIVRLMRA